MTHRGFASSDIHSADRSEITENNTPAPLAELTAAGRISPMPGGKGICRSSDKFYHLTLRRIGCGILDTRY
jgi:hypothetical protein